MSLLWSPSPSIAQLAQAIEVMLVWRTADLLAAALTVSNGSFRAIVPNWHTENPLDF